VQATRINPKKAASVKAGSNECELTRYRW
jgi:hypothetical protein